MSQKSSLSRQQGVILFIALVVLVFMSLAGVALMRSIDVGGDIAGNFATKQASLAASDRGLEQARSWLETNQGGAVTNQTLRTDVAASGYRATRRLDAGGNDINFFDAATWTNAPVAKMPGVATESDTFGNRVQYLIDRQCKTTGSLGQQTDNLNGNTAGNYNQCLNTTPVSNTSTGGCGSGEDCGLSGGSGAGSPPLLTYYRIVVRTVGPRNSVSYVQALIAQQVPAGSGG